MLTRLRVAFVAAALTLTTLVVPQPSVAGEPSVAACQGIPGRLPARSRHPAEAVAGTGRAAAGRLPAHRRTHPTEFLRQYWDSSANAGQGLWRYPPLDGFRTDPRGEPIRWVGTVAVGVELDRFGSEFGSFRRARMVPGAAGLLLSRQSGGAWEVGIYERGAYQVDARFDTEADACAFMLDQLI